MKRQAPTGICEPYHRIFTDEDYVKPFAEFFRLTENWRQSRRQVDELFVGAAALTGAAIRAVRSATVRRNDQAYRRFDCFGTVLVGNRLGITAIDAQPPYSYHLHIALRRLGIAALAARLGGDLTSHYATIDTILSDYDPLPPETGKAPVSHHIGYAYTKIDGAIAIAAASHIRASDKLARTITREYRDTLGKGWLHGDIDMDGGDPRDWFAGMHNQCMASSVLRTMARAATQPPSALIRPRLDELPVQTAQQAGINMH